MALFPRAVPVALLLLLLLPSSPAAAAPADATAEPHLAQVTLAPAGPPKTTPLWVRVGAAEPAARQHLELTVDLGGATAFADVEIEHGNTSSARAAPDGQTPVQAVLPCRRTAEKIFCSWDATLSAAGSLEVPAVLTVTPKDSARTGDSAGVTVTARAGDGPTGTALSIIQVGEGVDLAAGPDRTVGAAPGRSARLTPVVRNEGTIEVSDVVLLVDADPRLLGPSSFRNCRYGVALLCAFDTPLAPGRGYTLSAPLTLRSPADSVPGSRARVTYQWMTKADWADLALDDYGTPGRDGVLTLEPLAASQNDKPQSDVRPEDDYATATFTVGGDRRPALAAVGLRRTAAVGKEVVLRPGLVNFGPGTFRPDLFPNNGLAIVVRLPGNVEEAGTVGCEYGYCVLERQLAPGQRITFENAVDVTGGCGTPGRVEVLGLDGEVTSAAQLAVTVPGATCVALPITGPPVAWAGLAGAALVFVGFLLAVRRPGRPVCAHAGKGTWAGPPSEGSTR
ncbi:hypothetical protein [Actinoplanes sp. URMC 104]|uniref:hypothetical protein n=1 Tax=Actinoplanes sp. URMC 104 TaxID=3423409 RepID=UPI003F1BE105